MSSDPVGTYFFNELIPILRDNRTIERLSHHTKKRVSKKAQLKKLKDSYLNQKLVLVLGAGVSKVYGLPDWNTLLQKLLIKNLELEPKISESSTKEIATLLTDLFAPNNLILARNISEKLGGSDFLSLEEEVRDILYEEIDDFEVNPLFREIRQFA